MTRQKKVELFEKGGFMNNWDNHSYFLKSSISNYFKLLVAIGISPIPAMITNKSTQTEESQNIGHEKLSLV